MEQIVFCSLFWFKISFLNKLYANQMRIFEVSMFVENFPVSFYDSNFENNGKKTNLLQSIV